MDSLVILATLIITSNFLVLPVNPSPITSCTQTPYPQVCNSYVNTNQLSALDLRGQGSSTTAFLELSLKITMDEAVEVHQLVSSAVNLNSRDEHDGRSAMLAWKDCLELYEDTIDKLNRSMRSKDVLDANTWLSASIANQQTCQNGFIDLNIPDSHLQSSFPSFYKLSTDLSMLLSNSIAIHKASTTSSAMHFNKQIRSRRLLLHTDEGFPEWVSAADRKLLQSNNGAKSADIVVAQDGSGNYKSITEAVDAAKKISSGGTKRVVIYVKAGVYKENVEIKKTVKKLMFVGDGMDATIVTGNKNAQDGSTTFRSATFSVSGEGFIARDMTFENTAGPQKHQAVAFRSGADHSILYRCGFKGYQDTLYVYSQRQFYRDCDIYGTIDFIFGDAAAILQNCNIYVRKPLSNQINTVTAQSRKDPHENTGIIIHNSRITGAQGSYKTYLGRPWQQYSRTVIMKCTLDGLIAPQGWYPWRGSFGLDTLYYAEYMNTGAGAATGGRVKWPGFRVLTSAADAGKFTVGNFLAGDSWIAGTGVPFEAGL